jgi:hypothetical protein
MKRLLFTSLLLISSLAQAREQCINLSFGGRRCFIIPDAPPVKECAVLYEHPGFSGAAWGIAAETESADVSGAMIERRSWRGTLRGYTGRDRSWNDATSSIRVNPSCVLDTWTDSFAGDMQRFDGISEAQVPLNDTLSSFRCSCQETVVTNPAGDRFYYMSVLP